MEFYYILLLFVARVSKIALQSEWVINMSFFPIKPGGFLGYVASLHGLLIVL